MTNFHKDRGESVYPRDDEEINKARTYDKGKYGYYGYEGHFGYVPFETCMNICKCFKQGETAGKVSMQFNLSIQDTLTILTTWSQYLRPGTNFYNTTFNGGGEYAEIQKLKDKKPLTQEDTYEVLMDLEDFTKQKGDLK